MEEAIAPEEACPRCAGRGWLVLANGAARRCGCHGRIGTEDLIAAAGVPHRYRSCRLDRFNVKASEGSGREQLVAAKAACRRYIDEFLQGDGRFKSSGLLLIGPPGVGKTHLAAAVLIELIELYRVRGRFVDFTSLIHEIQATFSPDVPASKQQIVDPVCQAEVLVLDELGAQKPSAWVQDLLYLIINSRYAARLPTLFTTNYRLEEPKSLDAMAETGPVLLSHRIPAMLVSRLYEMAKPLYLDAADDFRRVVQMHQHG